MPVGTMTDQIGQKLSSLSSTWSATGWTSWKLLISWILTSILLDHQGLPAVDVTVAIYGRHHDRVLCFRTSFRFLQCSIIIDDGRYLDEYNDENERDDEYEETFSSDRFGRKRITLLAVSIQLLLIDFSTELDHTNLNNIFSVFLNIV